MEKRGPAGDAVGSKGTRNLNTGVTATKNSGSLRKLMVLLFGKTDLVT